MFELFQVVFFFSSVLMFDYFEDGEAHFVNLDVRSSYRNDHILQTYKEINLNYTIKM